jgi:PRTRC genetic system protein B
MAGIVVGSQSHEVALQGAILLYGRQAGEFSYATAHQIVTDEQTGRPVIGAGVPLNRRAVIHAVRQVSEEALPKGEFLTPNVLSIGPHAITWWCPPAQRRVFFSCKELGERSAEVPHPGLVFQAHASGFRVFALMQDERPTPETVLYEPPYFNTWDLGEICIGSAHVPKQIDVASIAGWEEAFFSSAFTHPNRGGKRVDYQDGEFAFWRDMLDGKFPSYPKHALIPMKKTLGNLIAGKIGE